MVAPEAFTPRWASPPGRTIRRALDAQGITVTDFAEMAGLSHQAAELLFLGEAPITMGVARKLEQAVGGTVAFWVQRDGQYRDSLALIDADRWAAGFPTADLARLGWIERPMSWTARIQTLLGFFDVADAAAWQRAYGALLEGARYRMAAALLEPKALAAWLRRAEVEAASIETAPWSADAFRQALDAARPLTKLGDPARFVPALTDICASAGVALVVVRAPTGCAASGAARFANAVSPQIALSARYLSDDHLWFTFYHEAAHLLLDGPGPVVVDVLEETSARQIDDREAAADAMAGELLLPSAVRDALPDPISPRDVLRAARDAGVSPGIVVGQLQHAGVIRYRSRYNALKRRYAWRGATLETA